MITERLQTALVAEVVKRLREYSHEDPAACLHIVYYDNSAPSGYVNLSVTSVSKRAELYAEDPADFWDGWGTPGNHDLGDLEGPDFEKAYALISEDGNEEMNMQHYRDALAKAALEINRSLPEFGIGNIADDFVVVLGDGARWKGGCDPADVLDCITDQQRQLLIKNGFWDEDDRY